VRADTILGWIAVGAAASLAAMIWPFRRGAFGIVVNLCAGIAGAVLLPLLSYLIVPISRAAGPGTRLFFAALGAVGALGVAHAAWTFVAPRRQARVHRSAGSAESGAERGRGTPAL
jgi:uncharacterized membrane protein YeaQ/YmgE (transglycosylase-associated protein family)